MSTKNITKSPKIVNLKVMFTEKPVTISGGMKLIAEFFRKLNLVEYLEEIFTPLNPKSNRGYAPATLVLSFIVNVLLGAKNISHTILLNFDDPIKKLFGLEEIPSISTFSRFFRKFKQKTIEDIFLKLNTYLLNLRIKDLPKDGVTIDLDSSVFERYGEQEGSYIGYNPKKPGRPSHHPIFAIISDIRFIIHLWLRRGDTTSSSGAIEFLKEIVARLPKGVRIKLIRGDSGFFGGKFFEYLENLGFKYAVVVKANEVIKKLVYEVKDFKEITRGIEISETKYRAYYWNKERRLVVVRYSIKERPSSQGKLFEEMPLYRYQVIITNLEDDTTEVWQTYKQRAEVENYIKELKYDYSMDGFSFSRFYATEAAVWMVAVVWNLLIYFKKEILGKEDIRLMTVRIKYFLCGGILGRERGKEVLRLRADTRWKEMFLKLLDRLKIFNISNAMQLNFGGVS